MRRSKSKLAKKHAKTQLLDSSIQKRAVFAEHIHELRKRLFWITVSVVGCSAGAYSIQHKIVAALLRPAKNQQFIYTTPGGGIDFLVRVCLYTGVVLSIPVIVYHLLKYLEPLIKKNSVRFIAYGSVVSGFLAIAGILFGYFLGMPAALHFLLHQFSTGESSSIEALISIQSYMSFVMLYMVGSALIFQIPLVLVLINRIKPLNPKSLLKHERWVVLISVIAAGIINPSPNITDQLTLAVPMILTYQIGVIIVWHINSRFRRNKRVVRLLQDDEKARLERLRNFDLARLKLAASTELAKTLQTVTGSETNAHSSTADSERMAQKFDRNLDYSKPSRANGGKAYVSIYPQA